MSQAALDLCQNLLRCPSVTPADAGALDVLHGVLSAAGFAVERVTFAEPGTPDIDNLYARIGGGAPHLMFAGHTDVVPPGDVAAWRYDPFAGTLADGRLWGRGVSDMKGGIAAFAAAAIDHVAATGLPRGSLSLLITGDEEGPAINGTAKLLDWIAGRGERFDHCLLGEPTNPSALGEMMKIGRRGSLSATLTANGRQGHVAYPRRADNPVPHLVGLMGALIGTPLDAGTARFEPSNLEIVSVDTGNPAWNVIPAMAAARFNIRFNDAWTPATLEAELRRRLDAVGSPYTLVLEPCNAVAFMTEPDAFTDLLTATIARHTGRTPELSTSGGTSDARFIRVHGPVIEFGLAGQTIHMIDEHVPVADLHALTAIYADVIAAYLGGSAG